jgi:hypothetical protein
MRLGSFHQRVFRCGTCGGNRASRTTDFTALHHSTAQHTALSHRTDRYCTTRDPHHTPLPHAPYRTHHTAPHHPQALGATTLVFGGATMAALFAPRGSMLKFGPALGGAARGTFTLIATVCTLNLFQSSTSDWSCFYLNLHVRERNAMVLACAMIFVPRRKERAKNWNEVSVGLWVALVSSNRLPRAIQRAC